MKELVTGGNKMSVINIYVNDENKVNVKDDTQIIKIKGDKGDPMRYEDLTPEQLEALKGPKGDKGENGEQGPKGEPFKYTDFTEEQLAALKGEKGETGEMPKIPNTLRLLKEKNVYLTDDNLDTVLTTVLNRINEGMNFLYDYDSIKNEYPFTVDQFNDGDENITVHGYNHFKVQIANEEPVEIIDNKAIVPIPKNTGDFINVKYINYLGDVVETKNVEKVKEDDTPAVIYQENNNPNMKLSVKGTKAVLEFIHGGRNSLRRNTLNPVQNKVKRLIIDLTNVDRINEYVSLPFVPEKIQIINYKANNFHPDFQGDYSGVVKIVSDMPVAYHTLNNDGEYEVSTLNGKNLTFGDNSIYVNDAL